MQLPVIIVNFKIYQEAVGDRAIELAKIHEKVARESGVSIAVAVSAMDLRAVCEAVEIPVFAQHIDPVVFGSGTGKILPELVKECGAYGTLLNHAEYQLSQDVLEKSIARAKGLGLFTIVCSATAEEAERVKAFAPDLIAVEPPELIGGDVSVSKADPGIIRKSVELVDRGRVLVGAGVKDGEDVRLAVEMGASGVLLASGVTKAADPYAVLLDLVSGIKG